MTGDAANSKNAGATKINVSWMRWIIVLAELVVSTALALLANHIFANGAIASVAQVVLPFAGVSMALSTLLIDMRIEVSLKSQLADSGDALVRHTLVANHVANVVLQRSDLFAMDFVSDQFDGVFCCDVLGHLVRAPEALREIVRVCRPGKCIVGNFFALEDTTRGREMVRIGGEEYLYANDFYFRFRDQEEVATLLEALPVETLSIDLAKWTEPPHEGYREYPHEHASWVFTVRKLASHT